MTQAEKTRRKRARRKKKRMIAFETLRDRSFSIIVPVFLGYILISTAHSDTIKLVCLILLCGFATGQSSLILLRIAERLGIGTILPADEKPEPKPDDDDRDHGDRLDDDDPEPAS
jgi:F0F1-type ATP synthase assembly protein I